MGVAVSEEHRQLSDAVTGWAQRHLPMTLVREVMDGAPLPDDTWAAFAAQGLLAVHLREEHGGGGGGPLELAVVCEALGRAMAPGPIVPTLATSSVITAAGGPVAKQLLPALADGSLRAAVAFDVGTVRVHDEDDRFRLTGTVGPVLGAPDADLLVVGGRTGDGRQVWFALDAADVTVEPVPALDATRALANVRLTDVPVGPERLLPDLASDRVRDLAVVPLAAEAAGIAAWCLDTAAAYARVREQFGRPIGQFQYVKHTCAEMLVRVEQARAVAWDAARALDEESQVRLASAVAAATALDGAVTCADDCIQILGGIGFTWEHDAHLYLRRATAVRQLLGGPASWWSQVGRLALAGARRTLTLDLTGEEADAVRVEVRAFLAGLPDDAQHRRRLMADAGYLMPHWPQPWGRDASPVEQLVIDEEFTAAGVDRPDLVIGGWILPTLIAYGTPEQQQRFIPPTLYGELTWCQLFSEPGAGSDLAALRTRATRVDGGWVLAGQKVWTSLAHQSDWGLCLARTDPDAPKHDGITAFVVDMRAPGIAVRPLRELTGREMFNEVFLDDVFVPDDLVVGPVNGGWRAARTTLANERVAMSSASSMGAGVEGLLDLLARHERREDPVVLDRVGRLVCEGQALALLGFRTTLARLSGVEPGASASVRKLVGGRHAQACAELALDLLGPAGATTDATAARTTHAYLQSKCLTIAGGTTAVQRNVIAERLLGLPRD